MAERQSVFPSRYHIGTVIYFETDLALFYLLFHTPLIEFFLEFFRSIAEEFAQSPAKIFPSKSV
ncbi:hypothetical protein C497_02022 [Halalkalicoccus jeotgali B3]|uniref:Uncharacterized protein n=1 Tax=Halalkalicoccus jeotgali (strain DSM 18796 / CECT 7217 / JCM 14584 / KCTC 4019 / B3) TaxID=795797 RepID=D8JBN7_HALJB|nr:hypothetical protein HacjB3_16701 [Halalkalicoccus jeotgali B3]ELY40821.1 hypothetical protein C497_02022 [Halalkalicoccus jeotgali B3]